MLYIVIPSPTSPCSTRLVSRVLLSELLNARSSLLKKEKKGKKNKECLHSTSDV